MGREGRGESDSSALTARAAPAAEDGSRAGDFSIGAYLARERRLRGIAISELAALTKIPTRSIERLEAGAFDANPDGFVRGFVRTIALGLGLDPEETVMRMLGEPADSAEAGRGAALRLDRRLWVAVAALVAVIGLGAAIWGWASRVSWFAPRDDAPEIVYRRDAVRALAEEVARSEQARGRAEGDPESVGSPGDEHSD